MNRIVDGESFLVWRESSGNSVEILDIHVANEARRSGVGTRMVEQLKNVVGKDCLLIYAITRVSNVVAQQFYEKLGFRIVGRLHNFYRMRKLMVNGGSGYIHAIMYGLDL